MNAHSFRISALHALPFLLLLGACSGMKLPKVSMPKLPDIKMPDIKVPFVGDDGTAPANDPVVPFNLRQTLGTGHTLEIAAYAGQRSPAKIFVGSVMVDEDGKVDLGKYGKVKLAGKTATQAVVEMEGAFRRKRGESLISVHLKRIEETPLLQVSGAVAHSGVIQFYDGATPSSILQYAGGRDPRATGRAVYVTREGVRHFHADYASADVELQRGDIVTYSHEL
jgi:protein involved in polysaccharide export with SLBB domain